MPTWVKAIWIFSTAISALAVIWFLFGVTANFQRSVDLVGRATFVVYWIPVVVMFLLSFWMLQKKWVPPGVIGYCIVGFIILLQLVLSIPLFDGAKPNGWLQQEVQSDPYRLTLDGKYEYRLEIVNFRQKNAHERIRIKDISMGTEVVIPLEIDTNQSGGLSRGGENWSWAILNSTEIPDQYVLSTTKDLNIPIKLFLINIKNKTSKEMK